MKMALLIKFLIITSALYELAAETKPRTTSVWKQDVVCKNFEAIKQVKHNITSHGRMDYYFKCGRHTPDSKPCMNKMFANTGSKFKSIPALLPGRNCSIILSNMTSVQKYSNGTTAPKKVNCVWRRNCIANGTHQEIARGARSSKAHSVKQILLYCCLVKCLRNCEEVTNQTRLMSIPISSALINLNYKDQVQLEICTDCSRGGSDSNTEIDDSVPVLVIGNPCCHFRVGHANALVGKMVTSDSGEDNAYYYYYWDAPKSVTLCPGEYMQTWCRCRHFPYLKDDTYGVSNYFSCANYEPYAYNPKVKCFYLCGESVPPQIEFWEDRVEKICEIDQCDYLPLS